MKVRRDEVRYRLQAFRRIDGRNAVARAFEGQPPLLFLVDRYRLARGLRRLADPVTDERELVPPDRRFPSLADCFVFVSGAEDGRQNCV